MLKPNFKTDLAIFEGPDEISIVFLRYNKSNSELEYKHTGIFSHWHPIRDISEELIGPEKFLTEEGIKTKKRIIRIRQSIRGNKCMEDKFNPRMLVEYKTLKAQVLYKSRLAKFYYDKLIGMMGEDKFKEMMKDFFKTTADVKEAGKVFDGGNLGYGGYSNYGRLGLIPRIASSTEK